MDKGLSAFQNTDQKEYFSTPNTHNRGLVRESTQCMEEEFLSLAYEQIKDFLCFNKAELAVIEDRLIGKSASNSMRTQSLIINKLKKIFKIKQELSNFEFFEEMLKIKAALNIGEKRFTKEKEKILKLIKEKNSVIKRQQEELDSLKSRSSGEDFVSLVEQYKQINEDLHNRFEYKKLKYQLENANKEVEVLNLIDIVKGLETQLNTLSTDDKNLIYLKGIKRKSNSLLSNTNEENIAMDLSKTITKSNPFKKQSILQSKTTDISSIKQQRLTCKNFRRRQNDGQTTVPFQIVDSEIIKPPNLYKDISSQSIAERERAELMDIQEADSFGNTKDIYIIEPETARLFKQEYFPVINMINGKYKYNKTKLDDIFEKHDDLIQLFKSRFKLKQKEMDQQINDVKFRLVCKESTVPSNRLIDDTDVFIQEELFKEKHRVYEKDIQMKKLKEKIAILKQCNLSLTQKLGQIEELLESQIHSAQKPCRCSKTKYNGLDLKSSLLSDVTKSLIGRNHISPVLSMNLIEEIDSSVDSQSDVNEDKYEFYEQCLSNHQTTKESTMYTNCMEVYYEGLISYSQTILCMRKETQNERILQSQLDILKTSIKEFKQKLEEDDVCMNFIKPKKKALFNSTFKQKRFTSEIEETYTDLNKTIKKMMNKYKRIINSKNKKIDTDKHTNQENRETNTTVQPRPQAFDGFSVRSKKTNSKVKAKMDNNKSLIIKNLKNQLTNLIIMKDTDTKKQGIDITKVKHILLWVLDSIDKVYKVFDDRFKSIENRIERLQKKSNSQIEEFIDCESGLFDSVFRESVVIKRDTEF